MRPIKHLHAYLIAAGLLVAFFLLLLRLVPKRESAPTRFAELHAAKDAVVVMDQPVGPNVIVTKATLSSAGFVVVQEDEQGPGNVLAASQVLPTGERRDFGISLKNRLASGWYYAVLYFDDGDGRFDATQDAPARNDDGSQVGVRFLIAP